jgi:DNA-binding TFAR19-related protein (PDSD5 family)
MKIRRVRANHRSGRLELITYSGNVYPVPYVKLAPRPRPGNRLLRVHVDMELGREAVTYELESGEEGSVHIDQALEYNQDPTYLAELLVHKLTVEARRRIEASGLSRRELARRLRTSVPQLYRLLDPTNTTKSISQLVSLLHVLDCDVQLVVTPRNAA